MKGMLTSLIIELSQYSNCVNHILAHWAYLNRVNER